MGVKDGWHFVTFLPATEKDKNAAMRINLFSNKLLFRKLI